MQNSEDDPKNENSNALFKMALAYIERIREYYQALGYGVPYVWARFEETPFSRLEKSLSDARIGIVTTAALYQPSKGEQGPGAAYNGSAKFYSVYAQPTDKEPNLGISHVAYDRVHTMADDQGSYFPLRSLKRLEEEGMIGEVSSRFYGLPTNRSQKTTLEVDAVQLLAKCQEDQIDAAILVPNCPVCHQSVSLAARVSEDAGISTVIMGCAKDIVEHVGVPRLLFNNFPLGNAAGLPHQRSVQVEIARLAVSMLATAVRPRTTEQSPFEWHGAPDWQKDYCNASILSSEEIRLRRLEFDKSKADAREIRENNSCVS